MEFCGRGSDFHHNTEIKDSATTYYYLLVGVLLLNVINSVDYLKILYLVA